MGLTNPHPLLIFAGSAAGSLATSITKYVKDKTERRYIETDGPGDAVCKPFLNGECMVRVNTNVRSRDVFVVQPLCRLWNSTDDNPYTGVNDTLMELLVWGDTLSLSSANRITAVIPSFAYSRQDRKAASRTPISAKLVCDLIQEAGFDRVLTMDLHSDQIQGFFQRKGCKLDHLNAGELFAKHFSHIENAIVLSPDIGNLKKANKYRKGMPDHVGIAVIDKHRDPITGHISNERITGDSVKGKNVIILDDIISTAGTIQSAVRLAEQHGAAEFRIGATHGEFVGPAIERLKHPKIKEIVITDSIPMLPECKQLPITVLSTGHLFGEAILRIHNGDSISELLGQYG